MALSSLSAAERVERAVEEIRAGRMIILIDDQNRENEGDLCMAAEKVTPDAINFMARYGRGLICLTLTEEKADALDLPLQSTRQGGPPLGTAFTVSIEARRGVTTGISVHDRAHTIRTAVACNARPEDLITPGHIFPLRAKPGGVLTRTGQTEGSVDLARMAGLEPAAVICEIMNDDGTMARLPDLERFSATHNVPILTIAELIEYRLRQERLVERALTTTITPAIAGLKREFKCYVYRTKVARTEFLALTLGEIAGSPILVRVQQACIPGDVFGSQACDCEAQMRAALRKIEEEGRGVFLYVFPSQQHSIFSDVETHILHLDPGTPSWQDRKLRDFGLGAQVLLDLGVRSIRLMSNNARQIVGLEGYGLTVVERVSLDIGGKNTP